MHDRLNEEERAKMAGELKEWHDNDYDHLGDDALMAEWCDGPPPSFYTAEQRDMSCKCGHSYERHFDPYEGGAHVGCKYCDCGRFDPDPDATCRCGHQRHSHHHDAECHCDCKVFVRASEADEYPRVPRGVEHITFEDMVFQISEDKMWFGYPLDATHVAFVKVPLHDDPEMHVWKQFYAIEGTPEKQGFIWLKSLSLKDARHMFHRGATVCEKADAKYVVNAGLETFYLTKEKD